MKSFLDSLCTVLMATAIFTIFFSVGDALIEKAAGEPAPPAVESVTYPVVYYQELKNLGGNSYLCEVWAGNNDRRTIMKLTASEKAKLQRGYLK